MTDSPFRSTIRGRLRHHTAYRLAATARALLLFTLVQSSVAAPLPAAEPERQPNIIFIMADENGNPRLKSSDAPVFADDLHAFRGR